MRDPGMPRQDVVRWNQTAVIWVVAFWAPVLGAYANLLGQAPDGLARNAALVYVAALAIGLAALTAVCVGAHALLLLGVRWLAVQRDVWRRLAAAGLAVAAGWLLALVWTAWATRLAHAFGTPQPLPDALADVVGVAIALAYLVVGLGVAGAPPLAGLLPEPAARAGVTSGSARVAAAAASAPRLIAPRPYPLTTTGAAAPAANTGAAPAAAAPSAPAAPLVPPAPALDTPLVLRYPGRASAPLAAVTPPSLPAGREVAALAPVARAAAEPRSVPVVAPRAGPRTVPVLGSALTPAHEDRVRFPSAIVLEALEDDRPA